MSGLVEPTPEMTQRDKIDVVGAFPSGPGVALAVVPIDIITAFYALTVADSTSVVLAANNLRTLIEPKLKPHLIALVNLPNPDLGLVNYWLAAFTQAAARGPRMLAALLYEAPPNTFAGSEAKLSDLLATLRTWPIP